MPRAGVNLQALLLATGVLAAGASVSESFQGCLQFFYLRTPPAGVRGTEGGLRRICQRFGDAPRYATLYDAGRRLPLYSAYTFKKSDGSKRVDTPWMYEPQLVSGDEGGEMRALPLSDDADPRIAESQAVFADYSDAAEYARGPLNPDQHQADAPDKSSTYALTNTVPQDARFLDASWSPYLDAVRRRLNNFCRGEAFVVTGVTVSGATVRRGNEDRLAVPKHLWLAYCCPRFDRNSPYEVRFMFPSYGGYALNQQQGSKVLEVPLKTLESLLKSQADMDSTLALFYRDCVSENPFRKKRK